MMETVASFAKRRDKRRLREDWSKPLSKERPRSLRTALLFRPTRPGQPSPRHLPSLALNHRASSEPMIPPSRWASGGLICWLREQDLAYAELDSG